VPDSNIPADGHMAESIMGQGILISPSRDLARVKVADAQDSGTDLVRFLTLVLDAIEDEDKA